MNDSSTDIPRWARERRDNTIFERRAALFGFLQSQIINMSIKDGDSRVVFRVRIDQIKEILNIPDDVLFADLKKRYLDTLFSDISNATELNLSIVQQYRRGRSVDEIAIEALSENRGCSDIITEITAFLKR